VFQFSFASFRAQRFQRAEAHMGAPAGGAADHFQHIAAPGFGKHLEGLGAAAQRGDGSLKLLGAAGRQPVGKGEKRVVVFRRAGLIRQGAQKFRRAVGAFPEDDAAVLFRVQRLEIGNPLALGLKLGGEALILGLGAAAQAHEPQRGKHGGRQYPAKGRKRHDLARGEHRRRGLGCEGGGRCQGEGGASQKQARCLPSNATMPLVAVNAAPAHQSIRHSGDPRYGRNRHCGAAPF